MKLPTYTIKELSELVDQTDTMSFLNRIYEIVDAEMERYSALERRTIRLMVSCKQMALTINRAIRKWY
ncbi:MAG: hypothetical protein JXQ90_19715 [Cyclobacteriaceae bacterium]